jgi:hypothetical protein
LLPSECFKDCASLSSIIVHDGITQIEKSCFEGCKSLPSFTIPPLVTSIPSKCFAYCQSLLSVDIHDLVKYRSYDCFLGSLIDKMRKHKHLLEEMIELSSYFQSFCPICFHSFSFKLKPFVVHQCQHILCQECFHKFFAEIQCPVCKQNEITNIS